MSIKEICIIPAWNLFKNDSRIKMNYFLPGLLSIIFLSVLLVYQAVYTYVVVFGKKEEALDIFLQFFHSNYVFEVIVASVLFLLFYLLVTPAFVG